MNFKSALCFTAALTMVGSTAYADDFGAHSKFDIRVNTVENLDVRVTPEFIFAEKSGGLRQWNVRVGPSYRLVPWLTLGVNSFVSQTTSQDIKVEPQVELTPRRGDLVLNDRNRLGYRPLNSASDERWQYANELKLSWDNKECPWVPFVSDELFISSKSAINQNRVIGGVGYKWNSNRLDVGYMLRSEDGKTGWGQSHFLYVSLNSSR